MEMEIGKCNVILCFGALKLSHFIRKIRQLLCFKKYLYILIFLVVLSNKYISIENNITLK